MYHTLKVYHDIRYVEYAILHSILPHLYFSFDNMESPYYNYEYIFSYHDVTGQNIYKPYEFYSPNGYFAISFYSEGKMLFFKGVDPKN
ncbi:hypothetical protein DKP85_08475 [Bacillus thuringiensis]|nr:hypothetical protein [Bacillus toyonensis biovar Thuringiensis]